MHLLVALAAIAFTPALAAASPPGATPPLHREPRIEQQRFAIAVNEPFFWGEKVIGISGYVGFRSHHAIRANVANYPALGTLATEVFAAPTGGVAPDRGGYFDIGAGWQWYPRELWNGPTVELGVLWRSDKTRDPDLMDTTPVSEVAREASVVAARGLVGWSWLFVGRVFIMFAAGGAVGYARGTETVQLDDYTTRYTRQAPVVVATPEGYLRFGWTF